MDVTFLVDTSTTNGPNILLAVEFAVEFIHGLDFRFEGAKVALVTFGPTATVRFGLDEYPSKEMLLRAFKLPELGELIIIASRYYLWQKWSDDA